MQAIQTITMRITVTLTAAVPVTVSAAAVTLHPHQSSVGTWYLQLGLATEYAVHRTPGSLAEKLLKGMVLRGLRTDASGAPHNIRTPYPP